MSEQESRLAQLKQLQEELQEQLLSQLSSISLEENPVSEETRLEILQTLGDKADSSRHHEFNPSTSDNTNAFASVSKSPSSSFNNIYNSEATSVQTKSSSVTGSLGSTLPAASTADPPLLTTANLQSRLSNEQLQVGYCNQERSITSERKEVNISNARLDSAHSSSAYSSPSVKQPIITQSSTTSFVIEDRSPTKTSNSSIQSPHLTLNEHRHHLRQDQTTASSSNLSSISVLHDTVHTIRTSPLYQLRNPASVSPQKDHLVDKVSSTTCEACVGLKAHVERLLTENTQWKVECCKLEEHIEECLSINKNFMEKNNRLMRRMASYQEECESKEQLVSMLQSRITSLTDQLNQRDLLIKDMKERNEELEEELGCCIREKKDLKELLHQTSSELDNKVNELNRFELKLKTMDTQLFNSNSEIHELQEALRIVTEKENQFQSTIYNLEEEIQSLRHINNRLNGQATHFQLSNEGYSASPYSYAACNNESDEKKLTSPHVTPVHQPFTLSPRNVPTSEDFSNDKRPLTRRKWLETSEGGLLFGTPSQSKENKENDVMYSPRTPVTSSGSVRPSPRAQGGSDPRHKYSAPVDTGLKPTQGSSSRSGDGSGSERRMRSPKERIEERVEERMRQVPIIENRLVELQKEKEKLEHILSKAPPTGKVTTQSKKLMIDTETRLDEVLKEIGAARLYLWKKR